jgi:hypothetical protein
MSGYDAPKQQSYNFGSHDFGAGAGAHAIQRPVGMVSGRVAEIHVGPITEVFNAVTTPGYVRIGTAADADKFAELNMGAAAVSDGYGTNDDPDAVKDAGKFIDLNRDGDSGACLDQLEVTFVAPTGGTPTGIGVVAVMMEWW